MFCLLYTLPLLLVIHTFNLQFRRIEKQNKITSKPASASMNPSESAAPLMTFKRYEQREEVTRKKQSKKITHVVLASRKPWTIRTAGFPCCGLLSVFP